jgi:hypothetical protein
MKGKTGKPARLFSIMGISITAFVLSACAVPMGGFWEYVFDNQTQYHITVSLNKGYKLSNEGLRIENEIWINDDLAIYSGSSKTVYTEANSLGFEWTASSSDDNRHIYPEITGSKATFKERQK